VMPVLNASKVGRAANVDERVNARRRRTYNVAARNKAKPAMETSAIMTHTFW
jgi:hypothetical protein